MNSNTRSKRNPIIVVILAAVLSAGVTPVFAHARLIKSTPTDTAQLQSTPPHVELWFNEILDDGFNSIQVYPSAELNMPKHESFTQGVPVVDPKDRTHLSITLSSLKPGDYTVDYRVLSRDGHTAPGRFTFHILPVTAKLDVR